MTSPIDRSPQAHIGQRPRSLASDSFALNLSRTLLNLCHPFTKAQVRAQKISSIARDFLRSNPLGLPIEAETWLSAPSESSSSSSPSPNPLSSSSSPNPMTQLFFLCHWAIHQGIIPLIKVLLNFSSSSLFSLSARCLSSSLPLLLSFLSSPSSPSSPSPATSWSSSHPLPLLLPILLFLLFC